MESSKPKDTGSHSDENHEEPKLFVIGNQFYADQADIVKRAANAHPTDNPDTDNEENK